VTISDFHLGFEAVEPQKLVRMLC